MRQFDLSELLAQGVTTPTGCIEWPKARTEAGYGRIWNGERAVRVHRLAAELAYGEPEPGMEVVHSCDNPPCYNPAHLRWGTRAENAADMAAKGRADSRTGEKNSKARLTEEQVREIRTLRGIHGWNLPRLADRFGVTTSTVHHIVTGKTWRHI